MYLVCIQTVILYSLYVFVQDVDADINKIAELGVNNPHPMIITIGTLQQPREVYT